MYKDLAKATLVDRFLYCIKKGKAAPLSLLPWCQVGTFPLISAKGFLLLFFCILCLSFSGMVFSPASHNYNLPAAVGELNTTCALWWGLEDGQKSRHIRLAGADGLSWSRRIWVPETLGGSTKGELAFVVQMEIITDPSFLLF